MANREQRSGKETRKPKKEKVVAKASSMPSSSAAPAKPQPTAWKQSPKKP